MGPREYIASLKGDASIQRITPSDLPEWLKTQWRETGGSLEELLESANSTDFAEYLLDRLSPRLPDELIGLLQSGLIAAGAINDPSPNAYMKKLGDEGYAIIFHIGLKDFIYRVARILATRFVPESNRERLSVNTVKIEETARLIADVFWWFQETNRAVGPSYPIHEHQIQIANLLALEAETFLLAHEIGHVIDDLSDYSNEPSLNLSHTIPFQHKEEHAADIIGLYLVMELHNKGAERHPFTTPLIYAGAEFALQIYQGLDLLGFEFEDSHPAASSRIQRIRSEMRAKCASEKDWRQLTSLAFGIEGIFSNILRIIQDPTEHKEFFDREAHQVISELDQLLNSCTGGMVPNYARFYVDAGQIFDRGYSHKMLERIAQVAADFFSDVQQFQNGKSILDPQSWARFQKFKLLLGYITQYMTEPARSIFLKTLESNDIGG